MKNITIKKGKPLCPYCKTEYTDAQPGDVKNYPDDKGFAVFMECELCEEEAELFFEWDVHS